MIEKAVNFGAAEALNQELNQSSRSAQSSNASRVLLNEDVKKVRISPCSEFFEVLLAYTIKKIKKISSVQQTYNKSLGKETCKSNIVGSAEYMETAT